MKKEESEDSRITWKWMAGIAGTLLLVAASAWAAKVDDAVDEFKSVKSMVIYIQQDIADIKELMLEALRKR